MSACPQITAPAQLAGYLTLPEAAKRLPRTNGRRIHSSTLWRWCRKGCRGIKLDYTRVGRTIMVTEEGLNRFFSELAKADEPSGSPNFKSSRRRRRRPRSAQRQRAIQESEAILRKAKILV
ncbi:MAG: helix-turn-helix domain-containing protein [Anaerohalosphaeraceae bacterium]